MRRIRLSKGKSVLVDDGDFEWLSQWSWHYGTHGYACRATYVRGSGRKNQKNTYVLMHRLINKTPDGFFTDHINRNRLDNRRSNLRTADKSLNSINRAIQPNNTSGHKGVHWFKRLGLWQVYINKNRKRVSLGYFKNLRDAVKARKLAEKEYHTL